MVEYRKAVSISERCLYCWAMPTDMNETDRAHAAFGRLPHFGVVDVADRRKRAPKRRSWRKALGTDEAGSLCLFTERAVFSAGFWARV